jgi:hypothetical protein
MSNRPDRGIRRFRSPIARLAFGIIPEKRNCASEISVNGFVH